MVIWPVNLARLSGLIRCPVVQHRQGFPWNRDASLSLLLRRGACAAGACGLRVCVARCDFADTDFQPRVVGSIGGSPYTLTRRSAGHGHIGCTLGPAPGIVCTGKACRSVRAQHLSSGRIMKRVHPGGPQATRMESLSSSSRPEARKSNCSQKPEKRVSLQPFTAP